MRQRLQNALFCKGFVKDLKGLERIWQTGLLSHEAPEAPKCSVLCRICKGFKTFEDVGQINLLGQKALEAPRWLATMSIWNQAIWILVNTVGMRSWERLLFEIRD